MPTIIQGLRDILGPADFFVDGSWDYAAMIEYFVAAVLLCIVVGSVFRLLGKWVAR